MVYFLNTELASAAIVIEKAVAEGRSMALLLEGVPGSGKTAFAKYLSHHYGWPLFRYDCNAESNSGLVYAYDVEGIIQQKSAFLKGPLWNCFESEGPAVMLIDEVDKSPRDFEAWLLRTVDEQTFRSPNNDEIAAKAPVVFILSSNARRKLSPEMERRCFRFTIPYPSKELLPQIVKAELPWGEPNHALIGLLCRIALKMQPKVEPDQMPSPKEIAYAAASFPLLKSHKQIQAIFVAQMLKGMTMQDCHQIIRMSAVKAIAKEAWK